MTNLQSKRTKMQIESIILWLASLTAEVFRTRINRKWLATVLSESNELKHRRILQQQNTINNPVFN